MAQKDIEGIHLIRVIAAFLVIGVHVTVGDFIEYGSVQNISPHWDTANLLQMLSRVSVPLFFLTTGYLLMDRMNANIWHFYGKSFLRLALPFIFFAWIFYLDPFASPWVNIKRIFYCQVPTFLWYMYALIGLYLFIPFGRVLIVSAPPEYIWIYTGLGIIGSSVLPWFEYVRSVNVGVSGWYNMGMFMGYTLFLFLGYKLKTVFPVQTVWLRVVLLAGFGVSIGLAAWWQKVLLLQKNSLFVGPFIHTAPLTVLAALCLFAALKDMTLPARWKPAIYSISACTFGIYLVHIFVLQHVAAFLQLDCNRWVQFPLLTGIVFVLSFAIVRGLKCIKLLKPFTG